MFGEVVEGIDGHRFETRSPTEAERGVQRHRPRRRRPRELVETFKEIYREETGDDFPPDAREQLLRAVRAVFESWDTPRAQVYRRAHDIPDDLGTAVNVVQMVFGNKGDRSGTGVAFTRDPSTGESGLYGEFLANAQGEDVVAGHPHAAADRGDARVAAEGVRRSSSTRCAGSRSTTATCRTSSSRSRTSSSTCCRRASAKRTAAAALKAAVTMVDEGLISREEAVGADRPGAARPAAAPDDRPEGARSRSPRRGSTPRRARRAAASSSTPTRRSSARRAGP